MTAVISRPVLNIAFGLHAESDQTPYDTFTRNNQPDLEGYKEGQISPSLHPAWLSL